MTFSAVHPAHLNSTHKANLLTLLTRRLEIAKAHHDQPLVAALEREYEQLTALAQPSAVETRMETWLQRLWMSFAETLSDWNKVHIEQTVDANGKPSWYAYNPQAGQSIVTESEADMHRWMMQSYWGK